jgi:hypothetical protein
LTVTSIIIIFYSPPPSLETSNYLRHGGELRAAHARARPQD